MTLFAGAKLIGGVEVGDGAQVGANAVVNRDVPAHHSAWGIPAVHRPMRGREPMEAALASTPVSGDA